jgi:rubrerythrin
MAGQPDPHARREAAPPFPLEDLRAYLQANAAAVREGYPEIAESLGKLAAEAEAHYQDLEDLERRLTVLEERMIAAARARQTDDDLLQARRDLDAQLRPYRGKMTADQLAMLERQYLERSLLGRSRLPRLSLFYMK